ncbi:MAG: hypothetical protein R3250_13765, partial [Melioribacteraceae bacterium]|nr:hypothetical protein [Melioribacteraceae bacterium]
MQINSILILLMSIYSIPYPQDFFSVQNVNEIEIIFEEQNWDEILDQYWRRGENERLKCTVLINGISFSDAGVRYKGFSSYKST